MRLVKQYQTLFEMEESSSLHRCACAVLPPRRSPRKTGARGLRSILENILLDTMFDLPGMEGVEEVVVNREVVENGSQPLMIYAEREEEVAPAS